MGHRCLELDKLIGCRVVVSFRDGSRGCGVLGYDNRYYLKDGEYTFADGIKAGILSGGKHFYKSNVKINRGVYAISVC